MKATREGRFKGEILSHGVDTSGQNDLLTFSVEIRLLDEKIGNDWVPLPPEESDTTITGWFFLTMKDGAVNTKTFDKLKACFDWDGADPFWLQDTDLRGFKVQATLANETYQNKTRLKWQWIDPENSEGGAGGVTRADADSRKVLAAKWGKLFRAHAGGTPAPAPKPSGKPTEPVARKPAPSAPATPGVTMQDAFNTFVAAVPEGWSETQINSEWFRIIDDICPGLQPAQITAAQWAAVKEQAPRSILPV